MDEKEYIEREAALAVFHDWIDKHGDVHTADEIPEYEAIENLPAADVLPVVHAEWIIEFAGNGWNEWDNCTCPVCRVKFEKFYQTRFCPNCGAKMDGGNKNG